MEPLRGTDVRPFGGSMLGSTGDECDGVAGGGGRDGREEEEGAGGGGRMREVVGLVGEELGGGLGEELDSLATASFPRRLVARGGFLLMGCGGDEDGGGSTAFLDRRVCILG